MHKLSRQPAVMPSRADFEVPAAKRQRVGSAAETGVRRAPQSSRIFSPFRVCAMLADECPAARLTCTDGRSRFVHLCALHICAPWQDHLPSHNIRRTVFANIRPAPRPQPDFSHQAANARGHHSDACVPRSSIRGMGRRGLSVREGRLGVHERKPGRPAGDHKLNKSRVEADTGLRDLDCRLWRGCDRSLEVGHL